MNQFANTKEIVVFAKSGAKLAQIAASVLQNDKKEGLNLLCEETLKAALAASLWNSPLKLLTVLDTVKNGKKTTLAKQWLLATTALSRELPENKAGDVSRIPDESAFVAETNAAIAAWENSWAAFETAQKMKTDQRANKPTTTPTTPTATPTTPTATPTFAESSEAANMRDEIASLQEKLQAVETRLATAHKIIRERDEALTSANEKITQLESALNDAQDSKLFLQTQLQGAITEIAMLRGAMTPVSKRLKAKKAETNPQ